MGQDTSPSSRIMMVQVFFFSFFNFVMGLGQDKIIFVGAGWERSEYPHLCHLLDHNRKWHSENNLFAN